MARNFHDNPPDFYQDNRDENQAFSIAPFACLLFWEAFVLKGTSLKQKLVE